jgi:hypothetical protein
MIMPGLAPGMVALGALWMGRHAASLIAACKAEEPRPIQFVASQTKPLV